ncbi:MAG: transporter substrate-binding domain-containing protein [Collinsella sp.]
MRTAAVLRSTIYRALVIVLTALTVLGGAMPAPVYAGDSDQQVKTVRVGWLVSNRGFQEGTPGERLSGWGYEYLQTLSYYTPGWQYEYVSGTFTELMDKLEAGEIDLMPNISYSEERAQKLLFSSNPEGTERYYIYARPDATTWPRVTPKRSKALPSATTPALCKPSSASSGSPTKASPVPIKKSTPVAPSLRRLQTARSTPSS